MESISALIFFGACLFIPMLCDAIYSLADKNIIETEVEVIKYIYKEDPKPTKSKKIKAEENSPIKKDAIQCLISLGMNKTEAKRKTDQMFEKTDYQSIESFLLDVYKV